MNNCRLDPFYKKTIPFIYEKKKLLFRVSQELFSSHIIDYGTQRLLRTLSTEGLNRFDKALDLGSGYGPIGIALKMVNSKSEVHVVDIDALALEYSRQNADLNKVNGLKIYGSLGYDNVVDSDFDLIVSNIPAKVGERVLSHILLDARHYLKPNGHVAIVVIDVITKYATDVLKSNDDVEILFQKSWPGHTIFHYKFTLGNKPMTSKGTGFSRGIYDRTERKFSFNKDTLLLKTTYNLPEFDTLSFDTRLLLDNLYFIKNHEIHNVIVINPGQGYVSVALSRLKQIEKIILVDRNLQSLEVSRRNLILNGFLKEKIFLSHQVGILLKDKHHVGCIVGVVPEKQGNEVYKMLISQSAKQLNPNGLIIFSSSSNVIFRIGKIIHSTKNFDLLKNVRSKGKRVIIARIKSNNDK